MDESGDDGYPNYSSKLFVLTSLYMPENVWKNNYNQIKDFRRMLKSKYNLPIAMEFHTKAFLTDKNPYRNYKWDLETKKQILKDWVDFIPSLEQIKFINVVIVKPRIIKEDYKVLDAALSYNIQRIENDLLNSDSRFLIITDEGRLGKMRKTARKMQIYNPIASKIYPGSTYRKEIQLLTEDILPKNSKESYFLQITDFVSYLIYLYSLKNFLNENFANRVAQLLEFDDVYNFLNNLKKCLNLKANPNDEFGVVNYPKNKK